MEQIVSVRGPELTTEQLHRLLRLRVDVFVVEQECPYPEVDGLDLLPTTTHVWSGGQEVASTLRLLDAEGPHGPLVVGRVVTAPEHRGEGLAARLMEWVLAEHGHRRLELEAQSHLAGWYSRFGFERTGPDFDWDGIEHTPMAREGQGSA
ncbi:GNAT family N-acetyltransferase [Kytococcus sp. Marseille-QA3725]